MFLSVGPKKKFSKQLQIISQFKQFIKLFYENKAQL